MEEDLTNVTETRRHGLPACEAKYMGYMLFAYTGYEPIDGDSFVRVEITTRDGNVVKLGPVTIRSNGSPLDAALFAGMEWVDGFHSGRHRGH